MYELGVAGPRYICVEPSLAVNRKAVGCGLLYSFYPTFFKMAVIERDLHQKIRKMSITFQ